MGGNCRFLLAEKILLQNVYSKTTLGIVYMIVKLIMMRPDFYLIGTVYSITVRSAVIYYEGLVYKGLDA